MADIESLSGLLKNHLGEKLNNLSMAHGELTCEVEASDLLGVCHVLRNEPHLRFEQLMDVCGLDYLTYGLDEWETEKVTGSGFSRGVERDMLERAPSEPKRFAVVYHLLSITHNMRLRLRCFAVGEPPQVPSVTPIWLSANWYEREAFDLFGILFEGHTDLRRILTDYGFIGHPFRKDFPLSGHVEVRYDPLQKRVIYQPVSIQPRVLVPRVIRRDTRTVQDEGQVNG